VNPEVELSRQQPSISPVVNPQETGADGRYGWDVVEGCWFVVVSAPGYEGAISPVVGVPPAVTDLDLEIRLTESKIYLPSVKK
jgi:hypothetical protein